MDRARWIQLIPVAVGLAGALTLVMWVRHQPRQALPLRVPGTDRSPGESAQAEGNPVLRGVRTAGPGTASSLSGSWPQFRGPARDGQSHETTKLLREWGPGGPRTLWSVDVGEGYAGPAVDAGRVFLMDYDREKQQDALRCLSLDDGREIWRFAYPVAVKRNHGMSRTVPTVASNLVVAIGPKCHVVCVDAATGELRWGLDLARDYGTTVPPWYAGQCPLVESNRVILAPAGPAALLLAVDLATGKEVWKTPNPQGWKMTHSSIVAMDVAGQRTYVYCGSGGVAGAAADDGRLLWDTKEWKISIATVPSPVVLDGDRLFLSGGYNAGSAMLQVTTAGSNWNAKTLFRLKPEAFGATQHTPVLHQGFLYGIHANGPFVCLDLNGKTRWSSDKLGFGLGPFLIADNLAFAVDDTGRMSLMEAVPDGFKLLSQAEVLKGHDAWAPLALAGGRLLARDLTRMVCLEVAGH